MTALRQAGRRALHAGALIFGAWWLVATSAPAPGPAPDCFTGIGDPTRLQVVLGSTVVAPNSDVPSCAGIDGLNSGGTLTFDLSHGTRPKSSDSCYGYETDALTGVVGVVPMNSGNVFNRSLFTAAYGSFASPDQPACRGGWSIYLSPDTEPDPDHLLSPLDAGTEQRWTIHRSVGIEQAQFCGAAFTKAGAVSCDDAFAVASITELPAP